MTVKQSGTRLYSTLNKKSKLSELRRRILLVVYALVTFRIGSFIPIPGVNANVIAKLIERQKGTIIEMFNVFSGGALSRASIFALGIMPYISASIVIQLLTIIHPVLAELKKEGGSGRRKINQYTRYGTLVLAVFQSTGIATGLPNMPGMQGLVSSPGFAFYFIAIISLVTGTMFLMWIGEQITDRGIGNGISIIIFAGIIAGLPPAIADTIEQARQGELNLVSLLLIIMLIFSVTFFVVFVERGQRRITISYAKIQRGRRICSIQSSTHLPLKVNMAGVIPAILSSSIIMFPTTVSSWFRTDFNWKWLTVISLYLQPGQLVYILFYASTTVFFCFFYTSLAFNPRETADNLKKSGAFVPGIRPGEQTSKYISKIITRLTLFGSIYITFICLIPELMRNAMRVPFYFGGTSLLIVVVVIMDFMSQIQTLMISSPLKLFLKESKS